MTDLSKTIEIIFAGVDQVSDVVSSIDGSLSDVGGDMQDIAAPFESAVNSVALLDAAILGLVASIVSVSSNIESEATKMKNALGLPTEEAERFEEVARAVYSQGYGDDLAASFEAVTVAQQKFADSADTDIQKVVTSAMQLEQTFGVDYSDSLSAAKTLMTNFGLSSEEAFDFIAAGYQKGLDGSGDFLESVNEYATQFSNGGADAGQFFSVLESGFQEGMLGTDKAADAFKEFRVRIQDGSKTTQEALDQLGLGEPFLNSLATGKMTAVEAFDIVIQKLNETDDSSVVMQAGVGLLGTQFEDLGTKAALSLSTTQTKMSDIIGTMGDFDNDTFAIKMTAAWRTAVDSLAGMDIWDGLKDQAGDAFEKIAANLKTVFADYDFGDLEDSAAEIWDKIAGYFADADLDLTTVDGMKNTVDLIIESIESLMNVSEGIVDIFEPLVSGGISVIETFNNFDDDTQELVGNILGIGTALGTVGGFLAAGGTLLGGISSLAGIVGTGGVLSTGLTALVAILTGPVGLAVALGVAGAAVIGFSMSEMNKEAEAARAAIEAETKTIDELTDQINALPANVPTLEIYAKLESGDYEAAKKMIEEAAAEDREMKITAAVEQKEFEDFYGHLTELGNLSQTEIKLLASVDGVEETEKVIQQIIKDRQIAVKASADLTAATETIEVWTEDHGVIQIEVPVSKDEVDQVKKDIEAIPTEKQIEITLQGNIDTQIAQIEASAKTAEAAFKYTAEVDIAQIEAEAQVATAAFSSVGESVVAMSDSVSSMFSDLTSAFSDENLTQLQKWKLEDIVEDQQAAQNKLIESQVALNEAQIEYMKLKMEGLQGGEALIKIDSTGLEPALEMVMWEILEKVQIRASEEAADFLLGIS